MLIIPVTRFKTARRIELSAKLTPPIFKSKGFPWRLGLNIHILHNYRCMEAEIKLTKVKPYI